MLKAGVGYVNESDAKAAGKAAAESALKDGGVSRPSAALAFCSGRSDADAFYSGLRETLGPGVPILGGSSVGVITRDALSYKGFPAAAAVLEGDALRARAVSVDGVDKGGEAAGRGLAKGLACGPQDKALLLFYDSVRVPARRDAPPVINPSAPLLSGLGEGLPGGLPVIGAGLVGTYEFGPTRQFCGGRVGEQCAAALALSGGFRPFHRIMHGCIPLDGLYRKITKMEGDVLYELDGRPIVNIIDEFKVAGWRSNHPVNYLSIGVNCGERYGEPREDMYINRLITGITQDGRGVGMFEPDLEEGMEIQFMIRDMERMADSAAENSEALLEEAARAGRPAFGLYIDCAGRTAEFSHSIAEEAAEVQRAFLKRGLPLLGFYSGVEIAPLMGRSRGLDWTGVLFVMAEER
jgi:hypothetical protein